MTSDRCYIARFAVLLKLNVSTGAVTGLGIAAWSPTWSPTGNQIAYLTGRSCSSTIAVVNADGTGNRVLTTDSYYANFDWSPDGQWLIAVSLGGDATLISPSTGMTIPLTFSGAQYTSVAWLSQ